MRGFTFIELIFVVVTLAILLAAAAPRFGRTLDRLKAERAAFEIAQLLRYAQSTAVLRQQTIQCSLATKNVGDRDQAQVVRLSVGKEPLRDRFASTSALPRDLAITIASQDDPKEEIWFFPNGSSEASRITVSHDDTVAYTVSVDAATGRAAVLAGSPAR